MIICAKVEEQSAVKKMKHKKVQNIFLTAALICSLFSTLVYADTDQSELQDQKADVQSELTDLQTELDRLITKKR